MVSPSSLLLCVLLFDVTVVAWLGLLCVDHSFSYGPVSGGANPTVEWQNPHSDEPVLRVAS